LDTVKSKWSKIKPLVYALALGLIAGPVISNSVGWQLTRSTSEMNVRNALIEMQATFCLERFLASGQSAKGLEYSARKDYAAKWAVMPGQDKSEYDVRYACAEKIGDI
jgi:hypothetical protein